MNKLEWDGLNLFADDKLVASISRARGLYEVRTAVEGYLGLYHTLEAAKKAAEENALD